MSNNDLCARCGSITHNDPAVAFFYILLRDHLRVSEVESIIDSLARGPYLFSNGWLAQYAADLVGRLKPAHAGPEVNVEQPKAGGRPA